MTSFIALRQASRRDASELAILADIASRGFASWLWFADVATGVSDTPLERGRLKMSEEEAVGGWRDAVIAEAYGEVAGVAIGHSLEEGIDKIEATVPATEPMLALQKTVVGSWFIGSLGVYRHLRGIGIGRRLLEDQIERADRRPSVSLPQVITKRLCRFMEETDSWRLRVPMPCRSSITARDTRGCS